MLLETAKFLASREGEELIERANELMMARFEAARVLSSLRKTGKNTEQATAAWEVAAIRLRAQSKLGPIASAFIYDRDGYEMASSAICSAYHADIAIGWGAGHIVDLCGGIGADAIAFAQRGLSVTTYEVDPARAEMIRFNAIAAGVTDKVEVRCADVTTAVLPDCVTSAFFDPARRGGDGRRMIDPEQLTPPLSFVRHLRNCGVRHVLVKLAPASDRRLGERYGGCLDYVSDNGECKEALLHIGRGGELVGPYAIILPQQISLTGSSIHAVAVEERVGAFVYEPDPAVIRAGLVSTVASAVDGWLLDKDIAYVLSDVARDISYAVRYDVVESFPFHFKKLRSSLNALGAGRVVVKKRAVAVDPAELASKLKLTGNREYVVFITRAGKTQWCLIATRQIGLVE